MVQPTTEPLARLTVVDELETRLSAEILDGTFAAGSLLPPERELAEQHGVNRTTLRGALARLERSGLIETRQGSGSRVRALEEGAGAEVLPLIAAGRKRDWLAEIFEARAYVGALVAGRAAQNRRPEDIRALRALLERIRTAPSAAEAQRADAELHRVLARATGNRVFVLLVNTMLRAYRPLHRRLRRTFADPRDIASALEPLVNAVANRQTAAAERAAFGYFVATERDMRRALREDP
jgi:GntR family transcriptional repressor for pyruvate dehydrogenase complex